MAPSEAQKRASNKYNLEHMTTLGCKLRKEQATTFKAYCANQGKTSNTVLKEYVLECIGEQSETPGNAVKRPGAARTGEEITLTPDTIKTAHEAAQAAGETTPQFIARAVETQAQRDKLTQKMKGGAF